MLKYYQINNNTYRLEYNGPTASDIIKSPQTESPLYWGTLFNDPRLRQLNSPTLSYGDSMEFNDITSQNHLCSLGFLQECTDQDCLYSRQITNIREKYENKIVSFSRGRTKLSILFICSYLLLQELRILWVLRDHISEVHLTDFAYKDFYFQCNNKYYLAFLQFTYFIKKYEIDCLVYLHLDPLQMVQDSSLNRTFDIIGGIDIDYHGNPDHFEMRSIIKSIGNNCLKIDGMMCLSQNFQDQLDLCHYGFVDGKIKLTETEDYVKEAYYWKYLLDDILLRAFSILNILCYLMSFLLVCRLPLLFTFFNLYYLWKIRCHRQKSRNNYKRKIKHLKTIMRRNH